ncbi:MAG TPA: elongation factor G [Actinomycetota bacterium]|nr:elongation factor G [Actinomycetota bacterium]
MKTYPPEAIRNVGLFGHQGTGKTTLAESLLSLSGATTRIGRVEDGNTVCDFEPEEIKKALSVSLALAPIEWAGHKINLIDVPGYADFIGEAAAALRVVDLAVFVLSAVEGVQVQHQILWSMAARLGVPRLVFINKLDRERASFSRTLGELTERLGGGFAPVDLPMGEEHDFHGVVDVLDEKGYRYDDSDNAGKGVEVEVTGPLHDEADRLHTQIVESVAESDDVLLERYLEGGEITPAEIEAGLSAGLLAGRVFPVMAGSASGLVGIDRLADFLVHEGPSAQNRGPAHGTVPGSDTEEVRDPTADAPLSAFVFKTVSDPYVGRISLFRVCSGRLRPDSMVYNASTGTDERIGQIFALRGKTQLPLTEVLAGDIAAVAKLAHTTSGDTLADKAHPIAYPALEPPQRALAKAIAPKTKGDEDKLMTGLARLQEEDPALTVERNAETHQTLLWGTGEAHLEVTLDRLHRKFGVEVAEIPLRIPYRETVAKPAQALGRHVKQTGGHGQYAIAHIQVEPGERGSGFEFVDKIVGGVVPNQFIPSVQKGVEKTLADGVLAGYPVVDVRVILDDGKFHPVDSSDIAFQLAGGSGFKEAAMAAGVVLLEPIVDLEVVVPDSYLGDIMGDLNSKRGRIQGTEAVGGHQIVRAKVPQAEVARYAIDLRSITGGQGTFRMEHSHYEEVPAHLADKIVAETKEAAAK